MISIGKKIADILYEEPSMQALVGSEVYNIINDGGTAEPFIVVRVKNISGVYSKFSYEYDDVLLEFYCVGKGYNSVTDVAEAARSVMEGKTFNFITHELSFIKFSGYVEMYDDARYAAIISFSAQLFKK